MKITELQAGDRVYFVIDKRLKPVQRRVGKKVIFQTPIIFGGSSGRSFTQCTATVVGHTTLEGDVPALSIYFISTIDPNNQGAAQIAYYSIQRMWIFEGETNIDTVVPKAISEDRDNWPYTAYQAPPMNIYRKHVRLVW